MQAAGVESDGTVLEYASNNHAKYRDLRPRLLLPMLFWSSNETPGVVRNLKRVMPFCKLLPELSVAYNVKFFDLCHLCCAPKQFLLVNHFPVFCSDGAQEAVENYVPSAKRMASSPQKTAIKSQSLERPLKNTDMVVPKSFPAPQACDLPEDPPNQRWSPGQVEDFFAAAREVLFWRNRL